MDLRPSRRGPSALLSRADKAIGALALGTFAWTALVTAALDPVGLPRPSPQLQGAAHEIVRVFARNTAVALSMVAAALILHKLPRLARGLLIGGFVSMVVGPALLGGLLAGQPGGLRFFAHAPIELAALALAAAWPAGHDQQRAAPGTSARRATLVALLLAIAAIVEVAAAPHV